MNLGPERPEKRGKGLTHQCVVLHTGQYSTALQVHHAGGQDHQSSERADHDGIGKHLKHPPHSLMHRLLYVGSGVDHDGRAETGFVGEGTALEAPGDGPGLMP